jgi:hypothetical protein
MNNYEDTYYNCTRLEQALEEYGDGEGLEMQDIPKRLLDNFAIKLFTDTPLAGDKGKQDEILDTMINQRQTIQMQYDMGLIDDDFMLELAEIWDNIHDPILDYERQEMPQMQGTWELLDNI